MTRLTHLALIATLCLGGTARGAERLPHVPLDVDGLKRLCEVVRPDGDVQFAGDEVQRGKAREEHRRRREAALQKFYTTGVPSTGFAFREYDAAEQRLAVESRRPFPVGDNVEVGILPGDDEPPELVAALPPAAAEAAVRLRVKNKLGLKLLFKLDPGTSGDPCARAPGKRVHAYIEPLVFELVEPSKAALFRGELPGYQEAIYATVPVKGPRVRVGKPTVSGAAPTADVAAGLKGLEAGFVACYQRGLESNAKLRGALVVGLRLEGGRVAQAHSEINSLGDDATVACVIDRLRAHRFAKAKGATRVSLPIYFSSEDD